jgi:hypothetical protein
MLNTYIERPQTSRSCSLARQLPGWNCATYHGNNCKTEHNRAGYYRPNRCTSRHHHLDKFCLTFMLDCSRKRFKMGKRGWYGFLLQKHLLFREKRNCIPAIIIHVHAAGAQAGTQISRRWHQNISQQKQISRLYLCLRFKQKSVYRNEIFSSKATQLQSRQRWNTFI